jgi:hypothetical protein
MCEHPSFHISNENAGDIGPGDQLRREQATCPDCGECVDAVKVVRTGTVFLVGENGIDERDLG